jgi:hypothetical protein
MTHHIECSWLATVADHFGIQEPLCFSPEAYRFIWRSSFDGDAVVYIARKGDKASFRWSAGFKGSSSFAELSMSDFEKLKRSMAAAHFWELDAIDQSVGFDGATWQIEGRRGGTYHSVQRWSPSGTIRDLGRLFFSLAGKPLASVKLY